MKKSDYGCYAEGFVCEYLEKEGYRIICRNFRVNGGEVDIIASLDEYICFVEIKYRTSGSGLETSIDRKKQRRLLKTAQQFIWKTDCRLQPRFDAAFVSGFEGEGMELEYIPNAFDGSCV